jgi:hypothetical protein
MTDDHDLGIAAIHRKDDLGTNVAQCCPQPRAKCPQIPHFPCIFRINPVSVSVLSVVMWYKRSGLRTSDSSFRQTDSDHEVKQMTNLRLFVAQYVTPDSLRMVFLLMAILALALAAGAPEAFGGGGH